ncbi:MAG TPA: FkbM family methyltransferase [Gemmata sp.]
MNPSGTIAPLVSVVVPVFNGAELIARALASVRRQTLAEWECVIVDDASTDGSVEVVRRLVAEEPRFRFLRLSANCGVSTVRNVALGQARGKWVAYLDQDDEFDPGYLAHIAAHAGADADVLMFRYDVLEERPGHPWLGRTYTHDPAPFHDRLFREHIAVPLGVAHRRAVTDRTGGFDERLPREQDAELWRRFAAAGAVFTFVPERSGRYHVRAGSASRAGPPDPVVPPRPAPARLPWRPAVMEQPPEPAPVALEVRRGPVAHVLHLPPRDAWVVDQIFTRGEYAGVPVRALAAPPVVVDVGAHCGAFAAYAAMAWHPGAVVHCFEPFGPHLALLRRNTTGFAGVTVHPFGLGAADGTADLLLDPGSGAGHSTVPGLVPHPAGRVPVSLRDAAAAWDELGLGDVDVLKVDAEGAEADILERLGPRLARVKVLLVEYHTDALRRRVEALAARFVRFGAIAHAPAVGMLKYVRADLAPAGGRTGPPRVLFASYHCFDDPTSGAALCTHDLFDLLAARGWACAAFTGPHLDSNGPPVDDRLRGRPGVAVSAGRADGCAFAEYRYDAPGGYPVAVFAPEPAAPRRPPTPAEARAFAARLAEEVRRFRPDVVLHYGGDPASGSVPALARAAGAAPVFWLHNRGYTTPDPFRDCAAVVVPSEASRDHYRAVGLDPVVLPGPWNWGRVRCDTATPRYVTFVNPEPAKGVFWFARVAEVLNRTRPDIPVLVVEGRGDVGWLARCGLPLGAGGTLRRMRNTPDPRRFYRLTRLVLMPSLVPEGLPRVAVEAMSNGIPVLGSGRGGLAEVLAPGGTRLDIPDRFTPDTRTPPTADEVAPWVAAIERLWDDPGAYAEASARARDGAARTWHPDVLGPRWADFLERVSTARVN